MPLISVQSCSPCFIAKIQIFPRRLHPNAFFTSVGGQRESRCVEYRSGKEDVVNARQSGLFVVDRVLHASVQIDHGLLADAKQALMTTV